MAGIDRQVCTPLANVQGQQRNQALHAPGTVATEFATLTNQTERMSDYLNSAEKMKSLAI